MGSSRRIVSARIWKTRYRLQLEAGRITGAVIRENIKRAGMKIGKGADEIIDKLPDTFNAENVDIGLVAASLAQLGLKRDATRQDIYERARKFGGGMCSAIVGLQLLLQGPTQSKGERLFVAMQPISGSVGGPGVFYISTDPVTDSSCLDASHVEDGVRCLHVCYGDIGGFWTDADRFVFVRLR